MLSYLGLERSGQQTSSSGGSPKMFIHSGFKAFYSTANIGGATGVTSIIIANTRVESNWESLFMIQESFNAKTVKENGSKINMG